MLKNKLAVSVLAGAMAIIGGIGGTALMASAQTPTATNTPVAVTNPSSSVTGVVDTPDSANDQADTGVSNATDTPESANDKTDTDNVQAGPGHQDKDGNAASEGSEPASSTDNGSDQ